MLDKEKIIKMLLLNILIALFNICLFSPGIIGIKIWGASTFNAAIGITFIIMSTVIFILGNYRLLSGKEEKLNSEEIKNIDDYVGALKQNRDKETFKEDISIVIEQIHRMDRKQELIDEVLLEKFNSSEMSYSKFQVAIDEIEKLFYINIKSIINKLNIFDEDEYEKVSKSVGQANLSSYVIREKNSIYNKYISFIKSSIEDNEEILLKLEKLLLELSKFNSLKDGELESMDAMKELDDLISKIKFYK